MTSSSTDTRFADRPLNRCTACRQDFTSLRLFEAHRIGDHALDFPGHDHGRRCLDIEEMQAKGWEQDDKSRWLDPEKDTITRLVQERASFFPQGAYGDAPQPRRPSPDLYPENPPHPDNESWVANWKKERTATSALRTWLEENA
jgi:hypothetical protein